MEKNFDNEIIADRLNGEWTITHANYLKIFQTKEPFNTIVDLIFFVDIEFEMVLFEKESTKNFKRWYNRTGGKPGKPKNNNNMNRSKSKRKNNSKRCPPDEEGPPTSTSAATSTTSIKSGSSSDSNDETDQNRPEIAIRHASSKEEFTKAWYDKYAEITKEVFSAQYILTY